MHITVQVDHPNCIKLYDVYITPRKVYIVTELVTGGELLDRCAGSSASVRSMPACGQPLIIFRSPFRARKSSPPLALAKWCRVTEKGNYTERDAAILIRQILSGVAYLHLQGKELSLCCAATQASRRSMAAVRTQRWHHPSGAARHAVQRCYVGPLVRLHGPDSARL